MDQADMRLTGVFSVYGQVSRVIVMSWMKELTVVVSEYESVHAPQAKHVEEVPRGGTDPAGQSHTD